MSQMPQQLLCLPMATTGSIVYFPSNAPRWSEYQAPQPGTVDNVVEEADMLETVRKIPCQRFDIPIKLG